MKDKDIKRKDSESILIALDQISQTIAVMTNVVERLRDHYIERENSNYFLREETNQTIH